jgi:hypothetical protein
MQLVCRLYTCYMQVISEVKQNINKIKQKIRGNKKGCRNNQLQQPLNKTLSF